MKSKLAFYSVFALKDGTVWFAIQKRKPNRSWKPKIDQDGIFDWYIEDLEADRNFTDTAKVVRGATIATCLNMRRIGREQHAASVDQILARLAGVEERLRRIETKLDKLTEQRRSRECEGLPDDQPTTPSTA